MPPRAHLDDLTATKGMLYTATSRLGHGVIGVFAVNAIPFFPKNPLRLCEFRSERGYVRNGRHTHSLYLSQADTTQHAVIRGPLLIDGQGNQHSYCTCIQENLRAAHYNCAYALLDDKIWILQTAHIQANEELSIQYATDGSY